MHSLSYFVDPKFNFHPKQIIKDKRILLKVIDVLWHRL